MLLYEAAAWLALGSIEALLLHYVTVVAFRRRAAPLFAICAVAALVGGAASRVALGSQAQSFNPECLLFAGIASMFAALGWHVVTIDDGHRDHPW